MERRRRISAYGLCRDDRDRVLLVRASAESNHAGLWLLPGGGIEHGEDPARGAVREVREETGLRTEIVAVRDVVVDVVRLTDHPVEVHLDRIIYVVRVRGGALRNEVGGSTELVRWIPRDELERTPLMPFAAAQLGEAPAPAAVLAAGRAPVPAAWPALADATAGPAAGATERPAWPPPDPRVGQRFAAYGLVTDPADRVLLTRIANGYPGAGRWHLPGGGTDFGEQPTAALLRELTEETDQAGVVAELMSVSHRHNPQAVGPEGFPIDWHTVRALYRVSVGRPTEARVTEAAGGSTATAAWFTRAEAARLPLTEIATRALSESHHKRQR